MAQLAVAAVMFLGSAYQGKEAKKAKEREAQGLHEAAQRRRAVAQREAAEEERNKDFVYSRALAVSAASGTGTADAGVVALLGDLNAEGEYRILSRLYAGEDEAEGLDYRAEIARREGKAAETAGYINGVTSAVSSYAAFS